jgi:signal peptidase I
MRSRIAGVIVFALCCAAWLVLAPAGIGGSTSYITTHGTSMEPSFHTGDLAVIRPASRYRIGDVVAYRSTLLHTVVLHRIVALQGARYVLKGDNNNFRDPTFPDHSQVVGSLRLRVAGGGRILGRLLAPVPVALFTGGAAALLLFLGSGQRRRRRRHARRQGPPEPRKRSRIVASHHTPPTRHPHAEHVLAGAAATAFVFLLLGLLAFVPPASHMVAVKTPYTERVSVAYAAPAPAGLVYPGGVVKTGDPVFTKLVHRLAVTVGYRLDAAGNIPQRLSGSVQVFVKVNSPSGWSRTLPLGKPARFTGEFGTSRVALDVTALRTLLARVETMTGTAASATYQVSLITRAHVAGTLDGRPLTSDFHPSLDFQLDAVQLRPAAAVDGKVASSRSGTISSPASAPSMLRVRGHGVPVTTARRIVLGGLLLAALGALLGGLLWILGKRRRTDPASRIHVQHGHLIVPIAGDAPDAGRPAIDVTSIVALVALAERSERLILHHHDADTGTDTYLVDDEGCLYRYRIEAAARPQAAHGPEVVRFRLAQDVAPSVAVAAPDGGPRTTPGCTTPIRRFGS